jgi:prepilin-type N-terminal cleavage/methylation domain-containing protein
MEPSSALAFVPIMLIGPSQASVPSQPMRQRSAKAAVPINGEIVIRSYRQRAFTLLELLAVIALIAILTAIVVGVGRYAAQASKVARAKAELAALAASLEAYKRQYGDYPHIASDQSIDEVAAGEQLYFALNGQRGPALGSGLFASQQRVLFERNRFTLADPLMPQHVANHFVDPWGHAYRYSYKPTSAWTNSSYLLVCVGADGDIVLPLPATGIVDATYQHALRNNQSINLDNLYANDP